MCSSLWDKEYLHDLNGVTSAQKERNIVVNQLFRLVKWQIQSQQKKMKEALDAHHTLSQVTNNKATHNYWKVRKAAEWLKSAGGRMTSLSRSFSTTVEGLSHSRIYCFVLHTPLLNSELQYAWTPDFYVSVEDKNAEAFSANSGRGVLMELLQISLSRCFIS